MTDTPPPALTERQQFWLKHLHACEAEGKPTIEYTRSGERTSTSYPVAGTVAKRGSRHLLR